MMGYPGEWYDKGPFMIWYHPSGATIVGTEPGYVLTYYGQETKFDDLYLAMTHLEFPDDT